MQMAIKESLCLLIDYSAIKLQINVIYRNFNAKLFTTDNERKEIHSARGVVRHGVPCRLERV